MAASDSSQALVTGHNHLPPSPLLKLKLNASRPQLSSIIGRCTAAVQHHRPTLLTIIAFTPSRTHDCRRHTLYRRQSSASFLKLITYFSFQTQTFKILGLMLVEFKSIRIFD
uniref:Uncharacterized protein n=1 Tax=Nelumbo nucifera TaxID=4432 RepID=A0A822Y4Q4_NELNU|nr:TPA_asm: hypothetical protein HUJ06_028895 [Nelumbo nucifera]